MKHLSALFILMVMFVKTFQAQDVLYTTGGSKIQVKVTEINTTDIKYKDFTNLEGPTSKQDIVLIQFSNGTIDVININPQSFPAPKKEIEYVNTNKTKTVDENKPKPNLYYMNNNLFSINALALANGDATFIYDREFLNNHLGITLLGGYNFNSRMGGLNAVIADSHERAKKNFDAGIGINFMPRNTKRTQYFMGVLAKYMDFSYKAVISSSNNNLQYADAKGSQLSIMFTNGWIYRISPSFNCKFFGSFGVPINTPEVKEVYIGMPKVYLGYCFGYRF
jgi:hypothetical protein